VVKEFSAVKPYTWLFAENRNQKRECAYFEVPSSVFLANSPLAW
jgi:hypothetical protein